MARQRAAARKSRNSGFMVMTLGGKIGNSIMLGWWTIFAGSRQLRKRDRLHMEYYSACSPESMARVRNSRIARISSRIDW